MKGLIHFSLLLGLALPLTLVPVSLAQAGSGCPLGHASSNCPRCPQCQAGCCEFKAETVDAEKHCWKVECKTICIPNVVFPWQQDCRHPGLNNGAKVKTVRVLKKHKYTCPECKYSWTPVDHGCCGVGCGRGGCSACDGMPIEMGLSVPEPTPAAPRQASPAGAPADDASAGFVEHQKVNVVSFVSRWWGK